jgi:hypothetical protein
MAVGKQQRSLPSGGSGVVKGEHVADIERIGVEEAHQKVDANQALLVCAYDDEAKCRRVNLEGSISLTSFQSRVGSVPKTQEIIFYCA